MSIAPTPTAHPSGQGEVLNVVGETIRILADSRATGGACLIFENVTPPGQGPPLHRHGRDDEYFFIVEGSVKFSLDGKETTVGAGAFVHAPRGSVHTFRNVGAQPCRMLVICLPAGLEGPFRAADRLAREGRVSPETLAAAFGAFDLTIHGPPLGP